MAPNTPSIKIFTDPLTHQYQSIKNLHLHAEHPAKNISKKRRTISLSSDDDIVELLPENGCRRPSKKRSTNHSSRKRDEFIDQI